MFPVRIATQFLAVFTLLLAIDVGSAGAQDQCSDDQLIWDTCTRQVCDEQTVTVYEWCEGTRPVCDIETRWVPEYCQSSDYVCDTGYQWVDDYCQGSNWVCDYQRVCEGGCDDFGCWESCWDEAYNCREETYSYVCGGHWEPYQHNCRWETATYECGGHYEDFPYNCREESYQYICGEHQETQYVNCRDEQYACNPHCPAEPPPPPPPVYGCMDPNATNYNPNATAEDGSCSYPEQPCPSCGDPEWDGDGSGGTFSAEFGVGDGGYHTQQTTSGEIGVNLNASGTVTYFQWANAARTHVHPYASFTISLVQTNINAGGHFGDHSLGTGRMVTIVTPTCNTGGNGMQCVITVRSNTIAGEAWIRATISHSTAGCVGCYIDTKVKVSAIGGDDFPELPETPAIWLIGETTRHPRGHFGVEPFLGQLRMLADAYSEAWPAPMCINDISLIRGGVFDLDGRFRPPHAEHQRGDTADIRSNNNITRDSHPFCPGTPVSEEGLQWMQDTLAAIFGHTDHRRESQGTSNEHWHVRRQAR